MISLIKQPKNNLDELMVSMSIWLRATKPEQVLLATDKDCNPCMPYLHQDDFDQIKNICVKRIRIEKIKIENEIAQG